MVRTVLLLLLVLAPSFAGATPTRTEEEIDATALLAGARELDANGAIASASVKLFDGIVDAAGQWDETKSGSSTSMIIELAEAFDLHRLQVVNSINERDFPGISTKSLRIEHASSRKGPWKPVVELSLKQGTAPQKHAFTPIKAVRYLRISMLANYGNKDYWGLSELSVFGYRSKPRAKIDFTGTWSTSYGPMRLVQTGERITGCYGDGAASIEGTREGPVLFGTYHEHGNNGAIALALTAEGDLAGVWGDLLGGERSARWDGKKVAKTPLTCGKKTDTLADELDKAGRIVVRGIFFDTGKDVIKPDSIAALTELAAAIKASSAPKLVIEGHTDNRGGDASNRTLSDKRAAAVKTWLVQHGIAATRLKTVGHGQSRPALPNDSEAGRAANRRVEVAVEL